MDPWLKYPVPFWRPSWGPTGWLSESGAQFLASRETRKAEKGPWCRVLAHLVFLLETVALGTLHLRDVLKQVCHSDGRVELPRLVGHIGGLPLLVCVGLHQAAGVASHRVGFI